MLHPRYATVHTNATAVTGRACCQRRQERKADPSILDKHRRPVHTSILLTMFPLLVLLPAFYHWWTNRVVPSVCMSAVQKRPIYARSVSVSSIRSFTKSHALFSL
ncbi:hypothetical protein J6590_038970 [Homalodisca vitripennis]|nr:hypothetical protein J6590_038970 [Homalodisca vitripennis]